jgi:hypothetical protein
MENDNFAPFMNGRKGYHKFATILWDFSELQGSSEPVIIELDGEPTI